MMKLTTKKPLRFLAALMVVVLLVTCIPLNVFGANEELLPFDTQTTENTVGDASGISENDSVSVIDGNVIGEYVEDISKREENVKHFANPDGTYTAIVYPTAVHRKDSDGVWQDINNDLALTTVKGGEKYASADSRVSFASRFAPSAELMTLSENGYSISMSLISDSKNESVMRASTESFGLASVTNAAKKELPKTDVKLEDVARIDNKSSIIYSNVKTNTDIEYILDGNAVKENIIVRAASNSYEYSFELRLTGLVATLESDGSIAISDAATNTQKYEIPAPYMYDAIGDISYAVEYTLIELSSGRYLLAVTADENWINATDRAFPVTIDPTLQPIVLSSDTYVSQNNPDENYCGAQDLVVGDGYTALLALNLPNLPEDSYMNSAHMYFFYYFSTSFAEITQISAYQITSSWNETITTYNSMPAISSNPLSTLSLAVDECDAYELNMECFDITEAADNWYYNNVPNNGIAIMYESGIFAVNIKSYDSGVDLCEFVSINYSLGLPTSSSEIPYNTLLWNYYPVVRGTNCYSYALNNQVYPNTNQLWAMQPGAGAGFTLTQSDITASKILEYVRKDAQNLGFTFREVSKNEPASSGTYKVALVVDPSCDYHWYRQNPDGTWSHKPGQQDVTNLDASGRIIIDPEEADRTYFYADYSVFVGFYEVTPLNNLYVNTQMRSFEHSEFDTIYFTNRKNNLPDYSVAIGITKGMLYSDVTEIIGLPQRTRTFGITVVEYDLSNNGIMIVEYVRNSEGHLVVESFTYENNSNLEVTYG